MKTLALVLAAVVSAVGPVLALACCHCPAPPPAAYDAGDSALDAADEELVDLSSPCGKACARLRELGCPEGQPSKHGASCYRVCLSAGALVQPACVNAAKDETSLHACGVRCGR